MDGAIPWAQERCLPVQRTVKMMRPNGPRAFQDGRRWPQHGPGWPQDRPRSLQDGPREPPVEPEEANRLMSLKC